MKRTLFLCTFTTVILFCTALYAADWSFSAEPLFGVRYGTVNEYVYEKNSSGDYQKLSELDWDIKPVFIYGGKIALAWKSLQLSGYAAGAIPGNTGSMSDSDWQNITINDDADTKTNYSISENSLVSGYTFEGILSYSFPILKFFSAGPSAGISYTYYSTEARNGYGWYADKSTLKEAVGKSYDSSDAVYYAKGSLLGIDYTREEMITWAGFTAVFKPVKQFTGTFSFIISPYTYIQSLDHHYGGHYFIDIMDGWFSVYRLSASAAYNFTDSLSLLLNVSWCFSNILYGDDYSSLSTDHWTEESESKSAASLNYGEASLGLRYSYGF
jgi:hypothetical protein